MRDYTRLHKLIEIWEKIEDKENKDKFYWKNLFPLVKEKFVNEYGCKGKYDYLIVSVGNSPEPIALSILAIKPKEVCFLHSSESKKTIDKVVSATRLKPSQYCLEEISSADASDVYKNIKKVWKKWGKYGKIAVDITGGKKAMAGGATAAGAFINAALIYIDSEQKNGKTVPGSEKLVELENPFNVFGDLNRLRAVSLFNNHQYSAAESLFKELRNLSEHHQYEIEAFIAGAYYHWDSFNYSVAENMLRNALENINLHKIHRHHANRIKNQIDVLKLLGRSGKFFDLLRDENDSYPVHLIADMIANAKRRADERNYNEGICRLYRAVEIIAQWQLAKRNIDTSNFKEDGLQSDELERLNEIRKEIYGEPYPLGSKIGALDAHIVLTAVEHAKAGDNHTERLKTLKAVIDTRNKLIVAHGKEFASKKDYEGMYKLTVEIFREYLQSDFEKIIEPHVFINLEE
ncbi:MAG: TIGR02710 family CRISPR-associated CARF protein [Candidatus Micrarchaeia archaeon]